MGRRGSARRGEAGEGIGRDAQLATEFGVGAEGVVDVIEGGITHGRWGGQPASTKSAGMGDTKFTCPPVRGCVKPSRLTLKRGPWLARDR